MSRIVKYILLTIGGLITSLVGYLTLRLWTSDEVLSILPGWHTTIYPNEVYWIILTIIVLLTSLIGYLLFRATKNR